MKDARTRILRQVKVQIHQMDCFVLIMVLLASGQQPLEYLRFTHANVYIIS